ncbi:MAG TPA: hypothetical protein VJN43_24005 [Bryobacteraceae bacterium]|nr:hypothetical protein [Bryobacteraceae bacterium]
MPFDILRLDQQAFSVGYLFERSGRPRYGTVVWLADADSYPNKNVARLAEASAAGSSLIAVASRVRDPALEQIVGLKFKEAYSATDPLEIGEAHFITREIARERSANWEFGARLWVELQGAQVLLRQGRHPMLTVRQPRPDTAAVWMAAPSFAALRDSPYWRGIFYRSLLWGLGYLVQPDQDYAHRILLMCDDWGAADKSFLSYWRYQTVTEELMREKVIPALARRKAVVSANVVTGFVDRKTQRVISPWTQKFTDAYGVLQDYTSTRRALKAAEAAGVLEIESHGWTHMQPDLDSPPGPWWTADLDGEASAGGWYEEFGDTRRGTEAPAVAQLFILKRSLDYLREDFGARPLSVIIGGGAWSKSYANHSARIAAQAGFGLFDINERYFYLDHDLTLDMAGISTGKTHAYDRQLRLEQWPPHPDGPMVIVFHDRDISLQHDFVERFLAAIPAEMSFVSMNQYIGILHTAIAAQDGEGWQFQFRIVDPYGAYFATHASNWRLVLADPLLERIRSVPAVTVTLDRRPPARVSTSALGTQPLMIEIPPGTGEHTWKLAPAR